MVRKAYDEIASFYERLRGDPISLSILILLLYFCGFRFGEFAIDWEPLNKAINTEGMRAASQVGGLVLGITLLTIIFLVQVTLSSVRVPAYRLFETLFTSKRTKRPGRGVRVNMTALAYTAASFPDEQRTAETIKNRYFSVRQQASSIAENVEKDMHVSSRRSTLLSNLTILMNLWLFLLFLLLSRAFGFDVLGWLQQGSFLGLIAMLISAVLLARPSVNRADGKLERARETALAKAIEQDPLWKTAVERAIYNWPTFADLAEEVASSFERKQVTFILPAGIRSTLLKAYLKRVKRPTSKRLDSLAWFTVHERSNVEVDGISPSETLDLSCGTLEASIYGLLPDRLRRDSRSLGPLLQYGFQKDDRGSRVH